MSAEPLDAKRALRFLRALGKNNDRGWFAANRDVYDNDIKPEWNDLVAGLLASHVPLDERFAYVDPRACQFRLYRDTRFSHDKTPYKDWISAFLSPRGKSGTNVGYYVQISPGECLFAAGLYTPEKEPLQSLRRHFADEPCKPFDRLLAAKKIAPYLPLRTEPLTRSPRGFPKETARPELVRARRYMVRRVFSDAQIVRDGAFATFRAAMRDTAAFVAYLDALAAPRAREDENWVD